MIARYRSAPHGTAYHPRLTVVGITLLICGAVAIPAGWAQLLERPVVIHQARILTSDGGVIENGVLVIRGGRIAAVGQGLKIPVLAKKIDVKGATITPGLIDVSSSLGMSDSSGGGATRRAEDAFNHYDTDNIKDALSSGITAVCVAPGGSAGILGTAAIMRLTRNGTDSYGQVLQGEAALCVDLGSTGAPITRLKTLASIQKQFEGALKHRQALKDYDEALVEYTKKLKERAAAKPAAKPKPSPSPKEGTTPPNAAAAEEEKKEEDKKDNPEQSKDPKKDAAAPEADELKKPQRPPRSVASDLLLRALDREIPVRVRAFRTGDILNALDLAEEFSIDLVLEGATESHLVAGQIADASASVLLGRQDFSQSHKDDDTRRAIRDQAAVLTQAGVPWAIGSGATGSASAGYVAFNAQMAAARSSTRGALELVTAAAADRLRVADKIGRLRPGLLADFVVWSGDPMDPASKVLSVYVGGALVYEATVETK